MANRWTCIKCGKASKYQSIHYASPVCEVHALEEFNKYKIDDNLKNLWDIYVPMSIEINDTEFVDS